jgi:hypothetical protein
MAIIRRCRYEWPHPHRERFQCAIVELAAIVDALVFFLTLGFFQTELRAKILFSDWFIK